MFTGPRGNQAASIAALLAGLVCPSLPEPALAAALLTPHPVTDKTATATPDISGLTNFIVERGFHVRDIKPGTRGTVVVISDIHHPAIVEANTNLVMDLKAYWKAELLGLEGYVSGPKGQAELLAAKEYSKISDVQLKGKDVVRKYDDARQISGGELQGSYDQFFGANGIKTIGLEGSSWDLVNGELVTSWATWIGSIKNSLKPGGALILEVEGQRGPDYISFLQVQSELVKRFPDFPAVNIDALLGDGTIDGKKARALGPEALRSLDVPLTKWLNHNCEAKRNEVAADKFDQVMTQNRAQLGIIVFGMAHTGHLAGVPEMHATIPELLNRLGYSVIVVDPFDEETLKNSYGIELMRQ